MAIGMAETDFDIIATIEDKIENGWRMKKSEVEQLTGQQYREWMRNRKRVKAGLPVYASGSGKKRQKSVEHHSSGDSENTKTRGQKQR